MPKTDNVKCFHFKPPSREIKGAYHESQQTNYRQSRTTTAQRSWITKNKIFDSRITGNKNGPITDHGKAPTAPSIILIITSKVFKEHTSPPCEVILDVILDAECFCCYMY